MVNPAVEADGVGGNGKISCAAAKGANIAPNTSKKRVERLRM